VLITRGRQTVTNSVIVCLNKYGSKAWVTKKAVEKRLLAQIRVQL
jgi:hypothetical protein